MKSKKLWSLLLLTLTCSNFTIQLHAETYPEQIAKLNTLPYPNFEDNPYLDYRLRSMMAPYLLPLDHPIKGALDLIFSQSRVTENEQTLSAAGFTLISASMPWSYVTIARHPAVPGYVFKLYLDAEYRSKDGIANCEWLARRCIGAEYIRNLIKEKNMRYFTVPDKWLYVLPLHPHSTLPRQQPVLVVETDMHPLDRENTAYAWKHHVKRRHLDELHAILKRGYGTIGLVRNLPYSPDGKFIFIDTEYPKRKHQLKKVKQYLSKDMQRYWEKLTEE